MVSPTGSDRPGFLVLMSLQKVKLRNVGDWRKVNFNPKDTRNCRKFRKVGVS